MKMQSLLKSLLATTLCFFFSISFLSAQVGGGRPNNPTPPTTPNPSPSPNPSPAQDPDFTVTKVTVNMSKNVYRLQEGLFVDVEVKNLGSNCDKKVKVQLFVQSCATPSDNLSKPEMVSKEIKEVRLNKNEVSVLTFPLEVFNYLGKIQCYAKINTDGITEKNFDNNTKAFEINVLPRKVDVSLNAEKVIVFKDHEATGDSEMKFKIKIWSINAAGTKKLLTEVKYPTSSPGYLIVTDGWPNPAEGGEKFAMPNALYKLKGLEETDAITYEIEAWEDENNEKDVFKSEDEYMGKFGETYHIIKDWAKQLAPATKGVVNVKATKSTSESFSIIVSTNIDNIYVPN